MPVMNKTLSALIALAASSVLAQATLTGLVTLKEGGEATLQVGKQATCLELPRPPKGLFFEGDGMPETRLSGNTLCITGNEDLWGKKVGLYLNYDSNRYLIGLRFNPDAPDALIRVRLEDAPPLMTSQSSVQAPKAVQPAPVQPPQAVQSTPSIRPTPQTPDNALALLAEVLSKLSLLMVGNTLASQTPPPPPEPPKPVPTAPVMKEVASSVTNQPQAPVSQGTPQPNAPEVKTATAKENVPLVTNLSVKDGKLFLAFTLVNNDEYPFVLNRDGLKVEFNGQKVTGEAAIRYTSGTTGWIPPKSSAIGSVLLDVPPASGKVRLTLKVTVLDPELTERTWTREWEIDFMPVIK